MPPASARAWDSPPSSGTAEPRTPFRGGPSRGPDRRRSALAAALVVSLALHLVLVAATALTELVGGEDEDGAAAAATPAFEIVDASELSYRPPAVPLDVPLDLKNPPEVPKGGRLVELAKPEKKETAPSDARFLAEHDRRVEQETRARDTALTPEVLADRYRGLGKDVSKGDAPTQGKSDHVGENDGADERNEKGGLAGAPGEKRIDEMLKSDPFGIRVRTPPPTAVARAGEGGDGAADRTRVAAGNGAKVAMAGAPNNDYLPDVREGDATLLNAKETFFASFWHRVLRQVEPFWASNVRSSNPGQIQKRDYRTVVNVVLSAKGELVAVDIVRSCGVPAWDRAVQEAFREGAPFLNPPAELVSADGRIYMDDLGFVVMLTGGQVVHMYGDPRSGKLFPGVREGYGPGR